MDYLNLIYWLKEGLFPPKLYLCSNIDIFQLEDGNFFLFSNCDDYLKGSIENVTNSLGVDNKRPEN